MDAESFPDPQTQEQPAHDTFVSIEEAVRITGLSRSEVNRRIGSGEFVSAAYKNRILVSKVSLLAYKERQAELETTMREPPPPAAAVLSIADVDYPDVRDLDDYPTIVQAAPGERLIILSDAMPTDGSRPSRVHIHTLRIVAWSVMENTLLATPVLPAGVLVCGVSFIEAPDCTLVTLCGRICESLDAEEEALLVDLQARWDADHHAD